MSQPLLGFHMNFPGYGDELQGGLCGGEGRQYQRKRADAVKLHELTVNEFPRNSQPLAGVSQREQS
jgi:hypothetical protein